MSKAAKGADTHITPELVEKVDGVLKEAEHHTYSVSRIYAAHNAVFQKNDAPQSCSSCLRSRAAELKKWRESYAADKPSGKHKDDGKEPQFVGNNGILYFSQEEADNSFKFEGKDGVLFDTQEAADLSQTDARTGYEGADGKVYQTEAEALAAVKPEPAKTDFVAHKMVTGADINFTPNADNALKGLVKYADGATVKPGKYTTEAGVLISVQPGGKATVKEEDLT